jgi:asparagine synthase (glutamine-hydrolysing)
MKADKMSMATSLELRVPFLDYRLVEWANRQPVAVKIGSLNGRNVTKRVLRRFASGRLPEEIIGRPKRGFPVPVAEWLRNEPFRTWAVHHITGKQAKLKDIFAAATLRSHLEQAAAGHGKAADRVWALLVLETWMREFCVDVAGDPVELLAAGTLA